MVVLAVSWSIVTLALAGWTLFGWWRQPRAVGSRRAVGAVALAAAVVLATALWLSV